MSTTDVAAGADPVRPVQPVGVLAEPGLLEAGRLGGVLLHGEPLVRHARRGLGDAGVELLPANTPWASLVGRELRSVSGTRRRRYSSALVVHDPRCPLTPAAFIVSLVEAAVASGEVQVGVRPVTDTIKVVRGGVVGETVDRDSLAIVAAPIVLPATVVATFDAWPDLSDLAALVALLRVGHPVELVPAPSLGRRVEDESEVRVLEAHEELDR